MGLTCIFCGRGGCHSRGIVLIFVVITPRLTSIPFLPSHYSMCSKIICDRTRTQTHTAQSLYAYFRYSELLAQVGVHARSVGCAAGVWRHLTPYVLGMITDL